MKIGVCFKIVPDYEEVPIEEWSACGGPDFTYVKKMFGCFDEAALETALCLKDSCIQSNIKVETVAITCGVNDGAVSESLLRSLFAAGFDDVVILPKTNDLDPIGTACALAQWFRENPADLIFTGRSTGLNDSGLVPYYLARELDLPVIGEVTAVKWDEGVMLSCKETADGTVKDSIKADLPCVVTVGDSETPILRLFPLKARLEARRKSFTDLRESNYVEDAGLGTQEQRIIRGETVADANCQMVEEEEAADFLMRKISEVRR